MKQIATLKDLAEYGIVPLTGESCAAGYRILCDLTAGGRAIIMSLLGLPQPQGDDGDLPCRPFAESWNHGSDDDPHIASVMLTRNQVTDLAVWALGLAGHTHILIYRNRTVAGYRLPAEAEQWAEACRVTGENAETLGKAARGERGPIPHDSWTARFAAQRTVLGDLVRQGRNVHQMSGRRS